jgi:hypothetical protein
LPPQRLPTLACNARLVDDTPPRRLIRAHFDVIRVGTLVAIP